MKKGDKRITYADRQKIEAMERTGAKVTDIAKAVGFHRATIYNELKRGGTPYRAEVAQYSLDDYEYWKGTQHGSDDITGDRPGNIGRKDK